MTRVQIVGGGRMGTALARGLLAAGSVAAADLRIVEVEEGRRSALTTELPGVETAAEPTKASAVVIAVKPDAVIPACEAVRAVGAERVLSIAAGVTLATLETALGPDIAVLRAMPNTPALVGAGAAAVARGTTATDEDLAWALRTLGAVGRAVAVEEPLLDAVTGLSGSGPAYIFYVVEALVAAGVAQGLPPDVSRQLTNQTVLGAARLLVETGEDPADLRAAVTSPGGTTAAGVATLEAAGVRAAFEAAVAAATSRSRELGRT